MKQANPQVNTEGLKLSLLFAAYLIIAFLLLNLSRSSLIIGLLHSILVICTPIVFYKIIKYQVTLLGATSFFRIFLHAINIYLFGALLLAGVQYLYYEYIAPADFRLMMEQSLKTTHELLPQMAEQFKDVEVLDMISSALFAMSVFQMNIIFGVFLSLIISVVILRKIKSNPA